MMPQNQDPEPVEPQGPLTPAETRRALWVAAVAWGIFGSAWLTLITGAPFASFARALGASTFMFGLLSSLPFLGVLAQLPSAYLVEKTHRRRRIFLLCASGQRLTWFVVGALPWLVPAEHSHLRVGVLLALVMLASAMGNAGTPAWLSWFADMVPQQIRGRYLGNRAALGTVTGVIAGAAVGWALDRSSGFRVFTIIFCLAGVFGITDLMLFLLVREPPMERREGQWRLRSIIGAPLSSRPFRGYLLYALSEALMFGLAGPFFWLMGLEVLKIGNFWSNVYLMLVPMVFTALTLPLWGNAVDRFGARPLVTLGTLMTIVFPVGWVLATHEHHHALLAVTAILGGIFGAAVQVADLNMLFSLTPRQTRSAYVAMVSVAASLGWVIGPAVGGAIAQALKPYQFDFAGRTFGNLHFLMLMSVAARVFHTLVIIPRLPEEARVTTRDLVRHLVAWPFQRVAAVFERGRI
jgi:MFS family permease